MYKLRSFALIGSALVMGALATPLFGQGGGLSNPAALKEQAPATFKANFDTSKGLVVIEVNRDWAPNGADRFYNLVKNGFYDEAASSA
jgi:peptidyl-prolyl cis-trans isomerase A (cyclophilin A)